MSTTSKLNVCGGMYTTLAYSSIAGCSHSWKRMVFFTSLMIFIPFVFIMFSFLRYKIIPLVLKKMVPESRTCLTAQQPLRCMKGCCKGRSIYPSTNMLFASCGHFCRWCGSHDLLLSLSVTANTLQCPHFKHPDHYELGWKVQSFQHLLDIHIDLCQRCYYCGMKGIW